MYNLTLFYVSKKKKIPSSSLSLLRGVTKIFQFTLERHLANNFVAVWVPILSTMESFLGAISYDVEWFTKTHIPFIKLSLAPFLKLGAKF